MPIRFRFILQCSIAIIASVAASGFSAVPSSANEADALDGEIAAPDLDSVVEVELNPESLLDAIDVPEIPVVPGEIAVPEVLELGEVDPPEVGDVTDAIDISLIDIDEVRCLVSLDTDVADAIAIEGDDFTDDAEVLPDLGVDPASSSRLVSELIPTFDPEASHLDNLGTLNPDLFFSPEGEASCEWGTVAEIAIGQDSDGDNTPAIRATAEEAMADRALSDDESAPANPLGGELVENLPTDLIPELPANPLGGELVENLPTDLIPELPANPLGGELMENLPTDLVPGLPTNLMENLPVNPLNGGLVENLPTDLVQGLPTDLMENLPTNPLNGGLIENLPIDPLSLAGDLPALELVTQAETLLNDGFSPLDALDLVGETSIFGFDLGDLGALKNFAQLLTENRFPSVTLAEVQLFDGLHGTIQASYGADFESSDTVPGESEAAGMKPGGGVSIGAGFAFSSLPLIDELRMDAAMNSRGDFRVYFSFEESF